MNSRRSITEGGIWDAAYKLNNYQIEYDCARKDKNPVCAIYFSSSGIYYPNTEDELKKRILEDDYYEWKNHRIKRASKHIFVRDVAKNFYVIGINTKINSIDLLIDFLKEETLGYDIITIGSSGGAYMAALSGILLEAKMAYCFSCFWSLNRINYDVWHLVGKYQDDSSRNKYYNLVPLIKRTKTKLVYVYPANNRDLINNDHIQCQLVNGIEQVVSIPIRTRHHGVCLNKYMLGEFINFTEWDKLSQLSSGKTKSEVELAKRLLSSRELIEMYLKLLHDKLVKNKKSKL